MLPFYAYLCRGARFIPEPLMQYRVHSGNTSMSLQWQRAQNEIDRQLVASEDCYVHMAHAQLMSSVLDRLAITEPERYREVASRIQPLLTIQLAEMAKKYVDARIALHENGVTRLDRVLVQFPTAAEREPEYMAGAAEEPALAPLSRPDGMRSYLDIAVSVPGWRDGDEAAALFTETYALPANALVVEIGAFFGRSTVLMAGARKLRGSGRVHCVDPFDCSGDDFSMPHYRQLLEENGGGTLRAHFDATIRRAGVDGWVEVHAGRAAEVAQRWAGQVDLLLLDGDHSPEGARTAYRAWVPHLRPGGVLVVDNSIPRDDYAPSHDGNRRVVVEEVVPPRFTDIRHIGFATFARKADIVSDV